MNPKIVLIAFCLVLMTFATGCFPSGSSGKLSFSRADLGEAFVEEFVPERSSGRGWAAGVPERLGLNSRELAVCLGESFYEVVEEIPAQEWSSERLAELSAEEAAAGYSWIGFPYQTADPGREDKVHEMVMTNFLDCAGGLENTFVIFYMENGGHGRTDDGVMELLKCYINNGDIGESAMESVVHGHRVDAPEPRLDLLEGGPGRYSPCFAAHCIVNGVIEEPALCRSGR